MKPVWGKFEIMASLGCQYCSNSEGFEIIYGSLKIGEDGQPKISNVFLDGALRCKSCGEILTEHEARNLCNKKFKGDSGEIPTANKH